jgi:DNA-binding FadR family transcriptional regulator
MPSSIDRQSLYRELQTYLRNYIIERKLQPGDQLPPASQMATEMGVSLASLREAMRALAALGVLETRQGVGTFVRAYDLSPILENLSYSLILDRDSFRELLELREAVEMGLLEKAITCIRESDISELTAIVERMHDPARREEADRLFHQVLYRCLDNHLATQMVEVFWRAIQYAGEQNQILLPIERRDRYHAMHKHILDAVRSKDVEAAKSALRDHLGALKQRTGGWASSEQAEERGQWPSWPAHRTN